MHHLVSDIVRTLASDYTTLIEREMHAAVATALGAPLAWDEMLKRCQLLLGPRQWDLLLDGKPILRIDLLDDYTPEDAHDGAPVLMSTSVRFTPL